MKTWRVIDIVSASVLGMATGVLFIVWNSLGGAWYATMDALTPGLGGVANGIWLIGGVLGGLIIRKPGAALYVELLAAAISATGNQWGATTVLSGLAQGVGAELVFLAWRRLSITVAVLAGMGAGAGEVVLELFLSGNAAKTMEFNLIYLGCTLVSGAVLAGLTGWCVVKALARTGVLDRFDAGRVL